MSSFAEKPRRASVTALKRGCIRALAMLSLFCHGCSYVPNRPFHSDRDNVLDATALKTTTTLIQRYQGYPPGAPPVLVEEHPEFSLAFVEFDDLGWYGSAIDAQKVFIR